MQTTIRSGTQKILEEMAYGIHKRITRLPVDHMVRLYTVAADGSGSYFAYTIVTILELAKFI